VLGANALDVVDFAVHLHGKGDFVNVVTMPDAFE
jgi:hypothetical protein